MISLWRDRRLRERLLVLAKGNYSWAEGMYVYVKGGWNAFVSLEEKRQAERRTL